MKKLSRLDATQRNEKIGNFVSYVFVIIIAMRIMGKRQVGDMQPSDLVVSLLISEIAAMPIDNIDSPMTNGILAVFPTLLHPHRRLKAVSIYYGWFINVVNKVVRYLVHSNIIIHLPPK